MVVCDGGRGQWKAEVEGAEHGIRGTERQCQRTAPTPSINDVDGVRVKLRPTLALAVHHCIPQTN